jgi:hypothetical protein
MLKSRDTTPTWGIDSSDLQISDKIQSLVAPGDSEAKLGALSLSDAYDIRFRREVILTTHHARSGFGPFSEDLALSAEHKLGFSDIGTDITAPGEPSVLGAVVSRGVVDLNRAPHFAGRAAHHCLG